MQCGKESGWEVQGLLKEPPMGNNACVFPQLQGSWSHVVPPSFSSTFQYLKHINILFDFLLDNMPRCICDEYLRFYVS